MILYTINITSDFALKFKTQLPHLHGTLYFSHILVKPELSNPGRLRLESLAPPCPNTLAWKFPVILKTLISWFKCLIMIGAKLYRTEHPWVKPLFL